MVRATTCSEPALRDALEAGDFYASSGVLLSRLEAGPDRYFVEVDLEPQVTDQTQIQQSLYLRASWMVL